MPTASPESELKPHPIQIWIVHFIRWYLLHPLTVAGGMAITGILIAENWHLKVDAFLIGLIFASLALVLWFRTRWSRAPLVMFLFMALHAHQIERTIYHPLYLDLQAMPGSSKPAYLRARLYPWQDGVSLNESRALAEVQSLNWSPQGPHEMMKAKFRVNLPANFKLTQAGVYELAGNLSLPAEPMNPGQFDQRTYALRAGWIADLKAVTVKMIEADSWAPRFHLLRWAETSRQWITDALSLGIEEQKRELGVLLAMALGVSEAAGEDVEEAFRGSGTLHIFAISGLHVVMLAGVMGFMLRWSGIGTARSVIWLIGLVFCYAYITGWRPSAARAALMISILLAAPWWDRKPMIQNSLGAALLILLAMDTQQLFGPGFQLSFAVLWAISLFASPLLKMMKPWTELDPFLPPQLASPWARGLSILRQNFAGLVSVSLAAWIGSLPLMLGHFQTLTPVGLIANLILVPASGLSMTLSCASLVLTLLGFTSTQRLTNFLNTLVAQAMIFLTSWFASWPLANVTLDLRFEKNPPAVEMQVFHLPSGGSAHHLRVGNQHWLLDTGDDRSWKNIVSPFLRTQGIDQLDGVILSHSDIKHVGAAALAAQMGSPRVHTSIHEPFRTDPPFSSIRQLARALPVDSLRWHRHVMGDEIPFSCEASLPVSCRVLYPMAQDARTRSDDRGLAILIQIGPTRVLWLADAGFVMMNEIIQRHHGLKFDVLIHSQHGTDLSNHHTLMETGRPKLLIDSVAPTLGENTPVFSHGPRRLNLYECGSVNLRFDQTGVEIRTFSTRESFRIETKP